MGLDTGILLSSRTSISRQGSSRSLLLLYDVFAACCGRCACCAAAQKFLLAKLICLQLALEARAMKMFYKVTYGITEYTVVPPIGAVHTAFFEEDKVGEQKKMAKPSLKRQDRLGNTWLFSTVCMEPARSWDDLMCAHGVKVGVILKKDMGYEKLSLKQPLATG